MGESAGPESDVHEDGAASGALPCADECEPSGELAGAEVSGTHVVSLRIRKWHRHFSGVLLERDKSDSAPQVFHCSRREEIWGPFHIVLQTAEEYGMWELLLALYRLRLLCSIDKFCSNVLFCPQ